MNSNRSIRCALFLISLVAGTCCLSARAQQIISLDATKRISLSTLKDADILRTRNGQQISVRDYRAALARAKAGQPASSTTNVVTIKPGATIASLAAAPANSTIVSQSGAKISLATLQHVQAIRTHIAQKQAVRPAMAAASAGAPVGEVGRDFTLAQALARNEKDSIKVGSRVVTVGQLKYVDALLKTSGQRSLTDLSLGKAQASAPQAKVVKVARGTDPKSLLSLPPETILESPGGKRINVATLRAHIDSPELKKAIDSRRAASKLPAPAKK